MKDFDEYIMLIGPLGVKSTRTLEEKEMTRDWKCTQDIMPLNWPFKLIYIGKSKHRG